MADPAFSSSLRICFVTSTYYPSPGATTPTELSRKLAILGHHVTVLTPNPFSQKKREVIDDVCVYRFSLPFYRPVRLSNAVLSWRAVQHVRQYHYDLLHIGFSPQQFLIPLLGKVFFRQKKIKSVYHLISVSIDQNRFRRFLQDKKTAIESRFFDAVLTSNQWIEQKILAGCKQPRRYIIPIGVDIDRFNLVPDGRHEDLKETLKIGADETVIIYIGTFTRRNLEKLVDAFSLIDPIGNKSRLLMLGSGEDEQKLLDKVRKMNLSNRIMFTGHVDYSQVPSYLNVADLAVAPIPVDSIYDIQPPLKTLEYLSMGLPVIATRTKANSLLVRNRENGLLIDDRTTALSEAMLELIKKPQLRKRLSQNARKSVEHLNWVTIAEKKLIPAYRRILSDRSTH